MDDTATIGHNLPPSDAEMIISRLNLDYVSATDRQEELLAGMGNVPETINDEETCETVTDYISQLKKSAKDLDEYRDNEKRPHIDANKTIQVWFKGFEDPLHAAATKLDMRIKPYHAAKLKKEREDREEQARKDREEADRLAREAAEAEAAATNDETLQDAVIAFDEAEKAEKAAAKSEKKADASVNDMTRTKSTAGTTSSMSVFPNFRNLNMAAIDLEALRPFLNQETIEQAIKAYIRHNKENIYNCKVSGVEFFEDTRSRTR